MSTRSERFEQLYEDHYGRVLGYALCRTGDPADAHDVVAETFLVAWRRFDEVPEGERSRLWLYGTARRVLANQRRTRRRQDPLTDRMAAEGVSASSIQLEGTDDWSEIAAAFSRLGDGDRDILLLAGWEELDAGQIAEVLGCTRATARVRLHRARRRFADQLEATDPQRSPTPGHLLPRRAITRSDAEEAL